MSKNITFVNVVHVMNFLFFYDFKFINRMILGFILIFFGLQVLEEALGKFEHQSHVTGEFVADLEVTVRTPGTPIILCETTSFG